jgi:hypothetical protein
MVCFLQKKGKNRILTWNNEFKSSGGADGTGGEKEIKDNPMEMW